MKRKGGGRHVMFVASFGSKLRRNNTLLNIRHLTIYSGPVLNFSFAEPVLRQLAHSSCMFIIRATEQLPLGLESLVSSTDCSISR
jgi:hypothetical protein